MSKPRTYCPWWKPHYWGKWQDTGLRGDLLTKNDEVIGEFVQQERCEACGKLQLRDAES